MWVSIWVEIYLGREIGVFKLSPRLSGRSPSGGHCLRLKSEIPNSHCLRLKSDHSSDQNSRLKSEIPDPYRFKIKSDQPASVVWI